MLLYEKKNPAWSIFFDFVLTVHPNEMSTPPASSLGRQARGLENNAAVCSQKVEKPNVISVMDSISSSLGKRIL